jgi:hypothetical protein
MGKRKKGDPRLGALGTLGTLGTLGGLGTLETLGSPGAATRYHPGNDGKFGIYRED